MYFGISLLKRSLISENSKNIFIILCIIATKAILASIRISLFEILLSSPLKLPDSLTELSMPKNSTRCFGLRKPSIALFLELLRKSLIISSLGASKIYGGVDIHLKAQLNS